MTTPPARKRKLIEVALPLDEINAACKADKDRKTGTIRNLHKWFAPMPLPAWRALLFAALVDDPGDDTQRAYLLDLIKRLVGHGADLPAQPDLDEAHALLIKQFPEGLPSVLDPFCGGGSTLVEAQRLGLTTIGTDLNPVPVLITRTLTELLPTVHGEPAIVDRGASPSAPDGLFAAELMTGDYAGLASDVLHYAGLLQDRAFNLLSDRYPARSGESVVAWLWARTAHCPNPVCGIETVLTTTWWLSKRPGALAWIEPEVEEGKVVLRVLTGQHVGTAPPAPKAARGASFTCINCSNPISETDLEEVAQRTGLGLRIVAVACDVKGKRIFRSPEPSEQAAASFDVSEFNPPATVRASDGGTRRRFGLDTQADLYVPRQIAVLATLADLVAELPARIREDGGSEAWVKAVVTILGLAVGRLAHGGSSQTRWKFDSRTGSAKPEAAFGRNDLPFTWDFVEVNPFAGGSWSWKQCIDTMLDALAYVPRGRGTTARVDARTSRLPVRGLVATDPPYFDAIGYADLSDYFYVWHRRALKGIHPDLYGTLATPKDDELTALPARHGNSREAARDYFISGFTQTFKNLVESLDNDIPLLVVYASREQRGGQDEATRWSSILTAMIQADLEITGTWPIHGTGSTRMIGQGANAVASYIAMVCRPRPQHAVTCSLADFNRALRRELGSAVRDLQAASILPVDMGQAVLGPGMQIYSRYRAVLDQSGTRVPVDQAIRLINAALGEVSDEQEGELDPESRFATRWWERYGWDAGTFGDADKTARPLGIGVDDVVRAQVATSQANKVQLVGRGNLDAAWAPNKDARPTAWEAVHHLAHRLIDRGGELEAARLMAQLGTLHDPAMALTYRLHDIAGAQGRTGDQERYNALINSWSELVKLSAGMAAPAEGLF